jgi:site-specific recombinase XerD
MTDTTALQPAERDTEALARFYRLADVPPEAEFFANLERPGTRRIYAEALRDFIGFLGTTGGAHLREVTRAHVIAWRRALIERGLAPATIRRKLAAVSAFYGYLCERNAVLINPVDGVKRPREGANEGTTPALGDDQARRLLEAPDPETRAGRRDRAILSLLLFHGLRRAELAGLAIEDLQERSGVKHLRVHGKGGKIRFVPVHPHSLERLDAYLSELPDRADRKAPIFTQLRRSKSLRHLSAEAVYRIVKHHAKVVGVDPTACRPHAMRATMATNALEKGADIAKVQEVLGHSSIATTRLYDRRHTRPQDSPVFLVKF